MLGSTSHTPKLCASGTKGTIDIRQSTLDNRWCSGGEQSWIVQKASCSNTSPLNSPGRLARDVWTVIASPNCNLLDAGKRGITGESEEATRHALSVRESKNMRMWLPMDLEPAAEHNEMMLPLTSFWVRSGAVLAIS